MPDFRRTQGQSEGIELPGLKNCAVHSIFLLSILTIISSCNNAFEKEPKNINTDQAVSVKTKKQSPEEISIGRLGYRDLRKLFNNKIHSGRTPDGQFWIAEFKVPDQAIMHFPEKSQEKKYEGTWNVTGDRVCIFWQDTDEFVDNNCMHIYLLSKNQYNIFRENGILISHMMLLE